MMNTSTQTRFTVTDMPTFCSQKVHHGGQFTENPYRECVNGKTNFIDHLEMDVLEEMLKQIGYSCDMVFYFHFMEPYLCLDFGLVTMI
ncbi:hypothetical protein Hanom_Chr10g00965341 [Helianthus anomalus]